MNFNENLKSTRKRFKITQKSISEHLGITLRTYQRYEEGKIEPPLSTISAIAEFFDLPVDCLLGNGFFSNWDAILAHMDSVLPVLMEELEFSFPGWKPSDFSEPQLARLLPAVFNKIVIDDKTGGITFYLLLMPNHDSLLEVPSGELKRGLPERPNA